ncbi:RNA polymerase sigma factor [Devosia sp. PTR5]|uniref:RNA polymerase sigma factor n=1 Tax=Devosia oryzisoli TaxID=2774138 RepID=A0A927FRL7_9HYPH|nr:RNA polymerase sigma factor [Devosia oryzisoli]MBD8064960.1 RNA polymerase sigma factor [Devosia oryzisoli]
MAVLAIDQERDVSSLDDEALVDLARHRVEAAVRTLIQRHNQRLFRTARAILRSDSEAEDVVQASYVKAFTHLDGFRGDAAFSTWITRIALNEALGRARTRRPTVGVEHIELQQEQAGGEIIFLSAAAADPEQEMARHEIRGLLEGAIDELPDAYRLVLVLRDVEGLSVEETAVQLAIKPDTVRSRLFRARRLLRIAIEQQAKGSFAALFPFDGARCVSMADRVIEALRESEHKLS